MRTFYPTILDSNTLPPKQVPKRIFFVTITYLKLIKILHMKAVFFLPNQFIYVLHFKVEKIKIKNKKTEQKLFILENQNNLITKINFD